MKDQLEKQLAGICGVYLVAGELSRRGYVALTAMRNLKTYDIIAYKPENKDKVYPIQVKTRKQHCEDFEKEYTPSIVTATGNELEDKVRKIEDNLTFVFVYLPNDITKRPRFFCSSFF